MQDEDEEDDLRLMWAELDEVVDKLELEAFDKRSQPFTVVDYLSLKPPRTMQKAEILRRLVPGGFIATVAVCACTRHFFILLLFLPGHAIRGTPEEVIQMARETPDLDVEDVWGLDWWGPTGLSYRGKVGVHGPLFCWYATHTKLHASLQMLHIRMDDASLTAADLDVSAGGRACAFSGSDNKN